MTQLPPRLNLVPVREVAMLPGARYAFKIGREGSKRALQQSLETNKLLGLFPQIHASLENPTIEDLHPIGVLGEIQQHEKRDDSIKLVVSTGTRIVVSKLIKSTPYFVIEPGEVSESTTNSVGLLPEKDIQDAASVLKKYKSDTHRVHSIGNPLPYGNDPGQLADYLMTRLSAGFENELACLLETNPHKRLNLAYKVLVQEGQRAQLESEINEKVTASIREEHRGIFLRGQLKAVLEELGEDAPLSLYDPIFRGRNFKRDPKLAFALMPFADRFRPIYDHIIKPVVEEFGLTCVRADDLYGSKPIMEDIWRLINEARIVIADVTGKNANVFYEVGLAHAIGKEVIILSQNIDDVPFDLRHLRSFVYQDSVAGFRKLESQLRKALSTIDGLALVQSDN